MNFKHSLPKGPFYRKFLVGNIGVEVNGDGKGGLWLHLWNCTTDGRIPAPHPVFHFDSEDQFMELCTKLIGVDHDTFKEFYMKWG